MNVTFDGPNKLIICGSGLTAFTAIELYSAWKDWVTEGDNSKYLPAFREIGGDPLGGGQVVSPYFFLTEGWRVRPQETNHALVITGNLLTEEGDAAVIPTAGAYNVMVTMITSSNSITTTVSGGSALTQEEHDFLMALPAVTMTVEEHDKLMAIISNVGELVIEGSLTLAQFLRIIMSAVAGKTTGGGTSEVRFRDLADAIDRIVASVDANGNRTAVSVNGS